MSTAPLLAVDDVAVRFGGVVALDGLTFSVAPHTIHALIGPNGSGKVTTLLNLRSAAPTGRTVARSRWTAPS